MPTEKACVGEGGELERALDDAPIKGGREEREPGNEVDFIHRPKKILQSAKKA